MPFDLGGGRDKTMTGDRKKTNSALVRRYTLRYLCAMGLVASSIILGALHIGQLLEVNRLQGEVIRTAAAQHTLAQQLILLPDRVALQTNAYKKSRALSAIREAMGKMQKSHNFLMNGSAAISPPADETSSLQNLYGQGLDKGMLRFFATYEQYLTDPDANTAAINVERVNAENFLLFSLHRAAELHTQNSEEKMAHAIDLHRFWVIASLVLVVLVIIFVFRPLARDAGRTVAKMSAEIDEGASLLSRSFKIAKMGHWRSDSATADLLWLSEELIDLLGIDVSEGFHPRSILQADDNSLEEDALYTSFLHTWKTGMKTVARSQFTNSDGDVIDLLIHMEAELNARGDVVGVVGVIKDDTAEAEAGRALMKSYKVIERKSSALIEAQNLGKLGTWRYQLGTDRTEWDDSVYELMGLDPRTFTPTHENIRSRHIEDGRKRAIEMHKKVVKTGEAQSETIRSRRGDGSLIDLHVRSKLQHDEDGCPIALYGTVQDVTKERSAARELEKLAYFDELTGLANRTLFTRELNRISEAAKQGRLQAALLLIDLDHFKEVNDTLGHQAGDQLLGIVANRLKSALPDQGFVARLGGDEFAVLVENDVSKQALDALCAEIIKTVSEPASLSLGAVQTNTSIGIALAPIHSCEPDELLRFADLALYSSKAQGRGRACYYDQSFGNALNNRVSLSANIRDAIDNKGFEVHYQPIVDMSTGKVGSFEALLRLPDKKGGFIPPSEFIPVAESSHLIADVGSFVLHEACKEAQSWIDGGLPQRTVSVNVSAAQIWHGDLEEIIDSALEASGLDPQFLCIELTESVFAADNIEKLEGILRRLEDRGIQLALDDFGTGYSSLGYLNRLPFDVLKIDRTFVSDSNICVEKQKMLQGVISLGKGLELKITAEGVETKEELQLMRKLGCDAIQGWFYSKALPAHQAVAEAARIDSVGKLKSVSDRKPRTNTAKDRRQGGRKARNAV